MAMAMGVGRGERRRSRDDLFRDDRFDEETKKQEKRVFGLVRAWYAAQLPLIERKCSRG